MQKQRTYFILTYGCQMNRNDSEHLAGMFESQGMKKAVTRDDADLVVLNTCSVRDRSERKVIGKLHELNYLRNTMKLPMELGITGCMPKRDKAYIQKTLPFLDHIIDIEDARLYPPKREDSEHAWISVMYGCNNFCSYCIVPYTRGRERSRPFLEILKEISEIDFARFPKIMLLGQNVNSYMNAETDIPQALIEKLGITAAVTPVKDFADLLAVVNMIPGIKQIDFLTSHPKDMSEKLIDTLGICEKMGKEIHFPLQNGNNRILQLMNRGYTYEQYKELVDKIRKKVPSAVISTDLIVGFPSETDAEFEDTLRAVREIKFHRTITNAFSPRPGTKAAELPGQLPATLREERLQGLMKVVDEVLAERWAKKA